MDAIPRKIIHIDMDAFFAAVEMRDFPQYRHKPLIVGGLPNSRGVVATCNYEARRYGVHSAMSSSEAYRCCPMAIFVRPRFEAYKAASLKLYEILQQYTERVETVALDEAYLDVTENLSNYRHSAILMARAIREQIVKDLDLTASAGVSYNKFLAKVAGSQCKPNGLGVILPQEGEAYISQLPIDAFHGVGRVTCQKMHALGIYTGGDLRELTLKQLQNHFGMQQGQWFYQLVRGCDDREVKNNRPRHSIGREETLTTDVQGGEKVQQILRQQLGQLCVWLLERQYYARTLTVKIKYANFEQATRSMTVAQPFQTAEKVHEKLIDLYAKLETRRLDVRLVGVQLSGLVAAHALPSQQLSFFDDHSVSLF